MAIMSKLNAAYLAGIIDGEGYIGILKSKKGNKKYWSSSRDYIYVPVIKVVMTDKPLIQFLKDSYGGCLETRPAHDNTKESYGWTVRKSSVVSILSAIYPFLRVKRRQAEIIFKYKNLNNGAGNPIDDDNWTKRDALYLEIRAITKKGNVRD
jgi:hypothetical protein